MVTKTAAHGNYHPQYWANRALRYLKEKRGIARLVSRAYDDERRSFELGDQIKIRQPGSIAAKDETDLTFETLAPRSVNLALDTYRHASYEVKDWDAAFAGDRLMREHIMPAVDSVANAVETSIIGLTTKVGPFVAQSSSAAVADVTAAIAKLMQNKCPIQDAANMFGIVGPTTYAELLELAAFTQHQGAGNVGVSSQVDGEIGRRYGFNWVPMTIVPAHTAGAGVTASAPKIDGSGSAVAKGTTSIEVDDTSLTGSVKAGDIITISGRDYAIAADASDNSNAITLTLTRGLVEEIADNTAVSFTTSNAVEENLMFHRDAFAYAMAPLPASMPQMASAQVATAVDPDSGLSLRLAMGWDIASKKSLVSVDALWGVQVLDDSLALRLRNAS